MYFALDKEVAAALKKPNGQDLKVETIEVSAVTAICYSKVISYENTVIFSI